MKNSKKEVDFNIRKTNKNQYIITRNGRALPIEKIEKIYRPIRHYPFSHSTWGYYHLEQLEMFRQDKKRHKLHV
jgi:hypothetical protein